MLPLDTQKYVASVEWKTSGEEIFLGGEEKNLNRKPKPKNYTKEKIKMRRWKAETGKGRNKETC